MPVLLPITDEERLRDLPNISQLEGEEPAFQSPCHQLWNPRSAPVLEDHGGPGMVLETGGSAVHPSPDVLGAYIPLQGDSNKQASQ